MRADRTSILISLGLIGTSLLAVSTGNIPFLGLILVSFAPTVLLIGVCLLIASLIPGLSLAGRAIVLVLAIPLVGTNTRLLALPFSRAETAQPDTPPISVPHGQWIKLETNVQELNGREMPFSSPRRACADDICLTSHGFRQPAPGVVGEYWNEPVRSVVMQKGLALSGPMPPLATLRISQQFRDRQRTTYTVRFELLNATGERIALSSREYRVGFPFESPDGSDVGALEYLLHANVVTALLSKWAGSVEDYPLQRFLDSTLQRAPDPQFPHMNSVELGSPGAQHEPDLSTEGWVRLQSSCGDHVSVQEERTNALRQIVNGTPTGTSSWWRSASGSPVSFVRDERGVLIAYAQQGVRIMCTDAAIYALSADIRSDSERILLLRSFDMNGTPDFLVAIYLSDTQGTRSTIDPRSFEASGSKIRFLRTVSRTDAGTPLVAEPIQIDGHSP